MESNDKKFTEELAENLKKAREIGCAAPRLEQSTEKYGGVSTAKTVLNDGKISDNFDWLVKKGRIELSLEALVADDRFSEMFEDDEVNACFELLCDNGYYKI